VNVVRSLVRAAAYLPSGTSDRVRIAAADEDAFTLAATAVERAWVDRDRPEESLAIHLLGEFPAMADWGFPVLLGHGTAKVFRHSGDAAELARTLRAVEDEGEGPALVVAADLPERTVASAEAPPPRFGAGSVAFLYATSDKATPSRFEPTDKDRSAVALALRGGKKGADGLRRDDWVGDWSAAPGSGRRIDVEQTLRALKRDLSVVSEGAYVPRARYFENLPSRWRFAADECEACHEISFPARDVCRQCRRRDSLTTLNLPRDGLEVVAVTTIGRGGQPTEFDAQVESSGPYQVALVEVAEGVRITLQVTDAPPGEVRVKDRVNTRLRRLYPMEGEWRYGRKAVPTTLGRSEDADR
jgi:scaffold protein (connect acetoacetyl-CoA thiolase and HMG-CoA synthase)